MALLKFSDLFFAFNIGIFKMNVLIEARRTIALSLFVSLSLPNLFTLLHPLLEIYIIGYCFPAASIWF